MDMISGSFGGLWWWLVGIIVCVGIGIALFYVYCQYLLSKKLEVRYSWMAWIPILNYINQAMIAGKTGRWITVWYGVLTLLWIVLKLIERDTLFSAWISLIMFILWTYIWISVSHGISKRTWHGKWWTVGLLFASWLFFPVTAFHYEKWDEVIPRPFIGAKKFFLIFFSFVAPILIIGGILAAALFPALTAYQDRWKDTLRTSHLRQISTALMGYQIDNMSYPTAPSSGCIPQDLIKYLPTGLPIDPTKVVAPGCDGSDGQTYAYRTGTDASGKVFVVLGAKMVTISAWNSNLSIDRKSVV